MMNNIEGTWLVGSGGTFCRLPSERKQGFSFYISFPASQRLWNAPGQSTWCEYVVFFTYSFLENIDSDWM